MRWLDYPFYRILMALIAGIVISRFYSLSLEGVLWSTVALFILCVFSIVLRRFRELSRSIFTFSSLLFFIGLGALLFHFQSNYLPADHYEKIDLQGENQLLVLELSDQLSSNQYNNRFYAQVRQIDTLPATGKVLVLFKRADSLNLRVGDRLTVFDDINDASNARNPGDFNYKEYLESIDVYGQVYVDKSGILGISRDQAVLPWYVELRNDLLDDLANSNLEPQPRALIEALVLGQRQNVDPKISQEFRDAGVIHILALSGLHVGILLLILKFCFKWMLGWKHGLVLQTLVIIGLLWGFAFLTGMSPSIMRAVTMFSFVAIGMNLNRKGSVFHSLTVSALVLLLIDSRLLFQVGFQLSYTAVLAIVMLQPIFASLLPRPRNWLLRNLWQIFTVTLAAQIGVAPLSIYYFHQFPLLFLLGNMLLLLVLPVILATSLFFIVLLQTGIPTAWLADLLNHTFNVIIEVVSWISSFDVWVLKDLFLTPVEVIFWYLMLWSLALFLRPQLMISRRERLKLVNPNYYFHVCLTSLCGLLILGILETQKASQNFMVLHQSRGSAVAISNGTKGKLLTHISSMTKSRKEESLSRLKNTSVFREQEVSVDSLPAGIEFRDRELLVIDGSSVYTKSKIEAPILLLSHSPKVNLNQVITDLKPSLIIADGSNFRNMVQRWEKTCRERKVVFINTYEHGAVNLMAH